MCSRQMFLKFFEYYNKCACDFLYIGLSIPSANKSNLPKMIETQQNCEVTIVFYNMICKKGNLRLQNVMYNELKICTKQTS